MGTVIKRDGRKQTFKASKIKRAVQKAVKEEGIAAAQSKKIIKKVVGIIVKRFKGRKSVRSSEIRKSILSLLDRTAKAVSAAWRKHERKRKRRK
ncbi:hypothetical protein HYV50_01200 [Candidatus Pacearchaeota archaeon]|nr:hypothetical protein [Candidatus Pacearchaeota archaeon]